MTTLRNPVFRFHYYVVLAIMGWTVITVGLILNWVQHDRKIRVEVFMALESLHGQRPRFDKSPLPCYTFER